MGSNEELGQAEVHLRQAEEDLEIARNAERAAERGLDIAREAERDAEKELEQSIREIREAVEQEPDEHHVLVEVATTSGFYPEGRPARVPVGQPVAGEIAKAAQALKLTNTANWIATVNKRQISLQLSYEANQLKGKVVIDWGPAAGGGGSQEA
jgi:hypothetical protein